MYNYDRVITLLSRYIKETLMKINIKHWLDNATIGQKIIIICLILVIVPTVVLGFVACSVLKR